VNRSITQALDNIATLNAMAARTRDLASALDSTSTLTTSLTALKSSLANLTSTLTLSADAQNVQLASASLTSAFSIGTTKYVGVGRPRDISFTSPSFSSSIKEFGSHSLTKNGAGNTRQYDTGLIPGPSRSWAFEGWVYPRVNENTGHEVFGIGDNRLVDRFFMAWLEAGGLNVEVYNSAGTRIFSGGAALANNTWHHILIVKNSSAWSLFIDGTRTNTSTSNLTATYYNPGASAFLLIGDNWTNSTLTPYYDDVSFHIGTTLGFDPTASSITVPTSARVNDPDTTRVLLHFDNDLLDDITFTALASASLSSTVSLSVTVTETQSLSANLSAVSTVTASGSSTRSIASDLTSTATLSATATRVKEGTAALSSTVTETVTATRISSTAQANLSTLASLACAISVTRDSVSALSSSTDQTIDYTRTRSAASAFTSAFSPTLIITAQRAGVALLESVTTLSASTARTREAAAGLTSIATVTVNAGRLIAISSSMTSASTLAIDYLHLVGVSASLASEFSTSTAATRTRNAASAITCVSALTAESSRTRNIGSDLTSASTQTATGTRIQPGSSALVSTVTLTSTTVKTATAGANIFSVATQSVTAVKTATVVANFAAIATELAAAFKNATGTITMESSATVTALVGKIIEYQHNNSHTGLQLPYFADNGQPLKYTVFPAQVNGYDAKTISIWVRRNTTTSSGIIIWAYSSGPDATGHVKLDGNSVVVMDAGTASLPYTITWTNSFPADTDWHHIFLKYTTQSGFYGDGYRLWVDGSSKGYREFQDFPAGFISFPSNIKSCRLGADDPLGIPGSVAQIRIGDLAINWWDVYDPQKGYVDLGPDGRGQFNQLSAPGIYATLDYPWTRVELENNENHVGFANFRAAPEIIPDDDLRVYSLLTAEGVLVLVLNANLVTTTALSAQVNNLANPGSQLSTTSTASATASRTRTVDSALSSQFTQSTSAQRLRSTTASITAVSSLSAITGYSKSLTADLSSEFTLACEATEILAIQGSAALSSQFTLSAAVNERQGFTITPSSEFSLACDATVKPPIRATADLTSTVTVTATLTKLQAFSVSLNSTATVTVDTTKIKGVIANLTTSASLTAITGRKLQGAAALQVQAFELTQGDILNFAPELTLYVTQETRARKVLPENRLYAIDSESRSRRVLPESRIITIEQETEVNII
jgi:hypothetical protein